MFGKIKLTSSPLSKLELDLNNPRLIGYRKQGKINNEPDIISIMVAVYGVKELIFSILTNGFHPDEILYSIPSLNNNRKIIVEGNRRLTACKIIRKPNLLKNTAHHGLANKILNHKNYEAALETINKLNVIHLTNRAMARTYIASKHTKESIKRWSVYTQGAYYIDLLNEYDDINSLRSSINNSVASSRIRGVILFSRITDEILELPTLSELERNRLLSDIDNIKVEAIVRLIQRSDFRKLIAKFNLDKSGNLIVKNISKQAYQIVLAQLARDSNFAKKLTTRQENEEEMSRYISELNALIAEFDKPESGLSDEIDDEDFDFDLETEQNENIDEEIEENQNNASNGINSITKPIKTIKKTTYLIDKNIPFVGHDKIDALIDESKKLNFIKFKYSSVVLSRTLIETLLSTLIKRSEIHDEYKVYSKHYYLQLDNLLDYYSNNLGKIFPQDLNNPDLKMVRHTLVDYKSTGKIVSNLAAHSDTHTLTEQEVTHVRAKLRDLLGYFLPKLMAGQ